MKILLFSILGLVVLLVVVVIILFTAGVQMPREHRSVVTVHLSAPRAAVWKAITDYAAMPQWWPALRSIRVEKLPDGTELTWNTDAHGHDIPFRTQESRVNEKLVRVIAKDDLPFGGTWTYELADANGGTQLTLTEDGIIRPPIFRAIAKWFFGLDTNQRDHLAHLEKHLAAEKTK
jgi:uncharacterized protein YndB with AHSA1/START domain